MKNCIEVSEPVPENVMLAMEKYREKPAFIGAEFDNINRWFNSIFLVAKLEKRF